MLVLLPVELLAEAPADGKEWSLRSLVCSAPTVFEEASLPDVLEMFRKDPTPLAFVRDEYGGVVGVLSPAELLSVLAGQMGDMPSGPEACRQADGSWIMPGRLAVDAVASWLGVSLPQRSCSATLAGLLLELMDRIPSEGDSVHWRGWRFEVRRMDGHRIDEVRVTRE